MYLECPQCHKCIRMPDRTLDWNKWDDIKCAYCETELLYKDRGSILITKKWQKYKSNHQVIMNKEKEI